MRPVGILACAAAILSSALFAGERPDPRMRTLVDPVRAEKRADGSLEVRIDAPKDVRIVSHFKQVKEWVR